MKMRKEKNEKRRILLNENLENGTPQTNGLGVMAMAKLQNVNKRVLAVVLAIIFVLTVVPTAVMMVVKGATTKEMIPFAKDSKTGEYTYRVNSDDEFQEGEEYYYKVGDKTYAYLFDAQLKKNDLLKFDSDTKDISWSRNAVYGITNIEDVAGVKRVADFSEEAPSFTFAQDKTGAGTTLVSGKEYYFKDSTGKNYVFSFSEDVIKPNKAKVRAQTGVVTDFYTGTFTLNFDEMSPTISVDGERYQLHTFYVQTNSLTNGKVYLIRGNGRLVGYTDTKTGTISEGSNQNLNIYGLDLSNTEEPLQWEYSNALHSQETTSIALGTPYYDGGYVLDTDNYSSYLMDEFQVETISGSSTGRYLHPINPKSYAYYSDRVMGHYYSEQSSVYIHDKSTYSHRSGWNSVANDQYALWSYNTTNKRFFTPNDVVVNSTQKIYLNVGTNTLTLTTSSSVTPIDTFQLIDSYLPVEYVQQPISLTVSTPQDENGTFESSVVSYSETMSDGDNGLFLDKVVTKEGDKYKVHLEAYQETDKLNLPETDVALVFDTSHNMANALYNWRYTNLATHPIFQEVNFSVVNHDNLFDEADKDAVGLIDTLIKSATTLANVVISRTYQFNKYVEDPNNPGVYVYLHQKYSHSGFELFTFRNKYQYYFTSTNGETYKTSEVSLNLIDTLIGNNVNSLTFTSTSGKSKTYSKFYTKTGINKNNADVNILTKAGGNWTSSSKLYIRDDYGELCQVKLAVGSDRMAIFETTDSKGQKYRLKVGNSQAHLEYFSTYGDCYDTFQGLYKVKDDDTIDYSPSARMLSKTLYVDNGEGSTAGTYTRLLAEKEAAEDFLYHVYIQAQKGTINLSVTNYDTAKNTQFNRALKKVDSSSYAEIDQIIAGIYNYEANSSEASTIDEGMTDAYNQLRKGESNSRKFEILFSGGLPADYTTNWVGGDNSKGNFDTDVANTAIRAAYNIKNSLKGTVYTIGMFENADSAEKKTYGNKFYYGNAWLHRPVTCTGKVGSAWGRTGTANLIINGLKLSIDPMDAAATNRMLNYISSDHATANTLGLDRYDGVWNRLNPGGYWFTLGGKGYKITKVAARTDNDHYFGVSPRTVEEQDSTNDDASFIETHTATADEIKTILTKVLEKVEQQTAVPNDTLTAESSLIDGITNHFDFDGASANDVHAYITAINGTDEVTGLDGVNLKTDIDNEKKTISVTGFPYTKYYNQYKINVDFYVTRREGLIGGNSVPSNLSKSAVYDQEGVMEENFEIPKVDLPIVMDGESITQDQATYYASEANLLDTINPYWIDGSNNEFVDITYVIFAENDSTTPINTYTVLAGESEGTWATPVTDENSTSAVQPQIKDTTKYKVNVRVNARSDDDRLADGKIGDKWYNDNEAIAYVFKPHFDVYNDKVEHANDTYTVTDIPQLSWELTDDATEEKQAELKSLLTKKLEPKVVYDVKQGDTLIATVTEESIDVEVAKDGHTEIETQRRKSLDNNQTGTVSIPRTTDFKVDNVRVTPNAITYEKEQLLSRATFDKDGKIIAVISYDADGNVATTQYYDAEGNAVSSNPGRTVDNSKDTYGPVTKVVNRPEANATEDGKVTYFNTLSHISAAQRTETMWQDADPARTTGEFTIQAGIPYKLHVVKKFKGPMAIPEGVKFTINGGGTSQEITITDFDRLTGEADGTVDLLSDETYSLVETFLDETTELSQYVATGEKTLNRVSTALTEKADTEDQIDFDFSVSNADLEAMDEDKRILTITITNTDQTEMPPVTGLFEKGYVNPFLIAAIAVAVLGGAYIAYLYRRRRLTEEQ